MSARPSPRTIRRASSGCDRPVRRLWAKHPENERGSAKWVHDWRRTPHRRLGRNRSRATRSERTIPSRQRELEGDAPEWHRSRSRNVPHRHWTLLLVCARRRSGRPATPRRPARFVAAHHVHKSQVRKDRSQVEGFRRITGSFVMQPGAQGVRLLPRDLESELSAGTVLDCPFDVLGGGPVRLWVQSGLERFRRGSDAPLVQVLAEEGASASRSETDAIEPFSCRQESVMERHSGIVGMKAGSPLGTRCVGRFSIAPAIRSVNLAGALKGSPSLGNRLPGRWPQWTSLPRPPRLRGSGATCAATAGANTAPPRRRICRSNKREGGRCAAEADP